MASIEKVELSKSIDSDIDLRIRKTSVQSSKNIEVNSVLFFGRLSSAWRPIFDY